MVLAACALLIIAFAPAQYFGRQQDDLLYFLGSRALLTGRYCLLTSPGCPPLTMSNPGGPLLLTPRAALTERPGLFSALAALVLAACPIALWAWLKRRTDDVSALLAAGLFASCPLVLAQSGAVMSEAPYLLVLLALLAAVETQKPAAAGGLAALLLLLRTAGLSAIPAMIIAPLRGGRRRDLALTAVPPALAYGLWTAWSWSKIGALDKMALMVTTYGGNGWHKFVDVGVSNAHYYLSEWGGCFLTPGLADGALALTLGATLAATAAWGLARALRRRADDPAAWALLGACVLHSFWGWQYERYMLPLLPLLLWALSVSLGRFTRLALAVLLVLQLGAQTLPRLGKTSPWAEPELKDTYAWLAARPRPALMSSALFVRDGWHSGLPSLPLPDEPRASAFAADLKTRRVRFVLRAGGLDIGLHSDPTSPLRLHLERVDAYLWDPRLFRKVYANAQEKTEVYEPL